MISFEIIRDIILISGWPVLIISSIFVSVKIFYHYKSGENVTSKRLVFVMLIGLLVSMYGLATVATIFMLSNVIFGVLVVLPVFIVWLPSIAVVVWVTYNLK